MYVLLVPLLPLLAALMVLGGEAGRLRERASLALLPLAAAFAGSVGALAHVAAGDGYTIRFYDPASVAGLMRPLGLQVDRLGALMMVLISGTGALVFKYSINYMFQDPHYGRFLALVGVTTSVLLCMVASVNLAMLFLCWQLLSYLLFLLAHNLGHTATRAGARRTFHFLRFGDAAFLAGIALAYRLYGTVEFPELFARAAAVPVMLPLGAGWEVSGATAVAMLLFVGVMSKSVQFPLHAWLPHSLYSPTPVSALLHAGLINAGGFLLNRLAPLYALSPAALHLALAVGAVTTVLGAAMMLTQNDIKKTLGFSTMGQMGYMVMECGLGAFALAVFHLIAHGMFKAAVFLNCGHVVHKARLEPALPPASAWHAPAGDGPAAGAELSALSWMTGLFTTLLMPLFILLIAHGTLRIPLLDSQSTVIFLFFIWITSSQALLTLTRLRTVASWKVAATMLVTLLAVVVTHLFAAERFTAFLYPDPAMVSAYYRAAALPGALFDATVVLGALSTIFGWAWLYARSRGRRVRLPGTVERLRARLYVLLMANLFLDRQLSVDHPGRPEQPAPRELTVTGALALHAALGIAPLCALAALAGGAPGMHDALARAGVVLGWLGLSVLVLGWTERTAPHGAAVANALVMR